MLLHDPDPIPTLIPVEMKAQSIPRAGGLREFGEGTRALLCCLLKSHVVYLGLVSYLDDRQPAPVNCGLSPMHMAAVRCHRSRGEFHSTLCAWYPPSESLLV